MRLRIEPKCSTKLNIEVLERNGALMRGMQSIQRCEIRPGRALETDSIQIGLKLHSETPHGSAAIPVESLAGGRAFRAALEIRPWAIEVPFPKPNM